MDSTVPSALGLSSVPTASSLSMTVTASAWDLDASILILGIRGTGFRLVDADQHFYQATGLPRALYLSRHGFEAYRKHELHLMRTLLQENPTRSIIVCGPGSAEGTGQELLKDFRKRHPVIYILRDPEDIDQYLRTKDVAKITKLSELASPSYRQLSNFEFYNLSERLESMNSLGAQYQHHPSLILKDVEQDFIRLIYSIRSQSSRPRVLQARHSLSFLPPESKPFTYALTVPVQIVSDIALELRRTDLVVDAVELVIDLSFLLADSKAFNNSIATYLTKEYHTLRRNVRLPVIFHVCFSDANLPGAFVPPPAKRIETYGEVLDHGLRLAPDYLTIDLSYDDDSAQSLIARKVGTKIIGHFSDPQPEPGAWDSASRFHLLEKANQWGCDLVRICQYSSSFEDNTARQRFLFQADRLGLSRMPLIALNIGRYGRASSFTNSTLTPVTHALIQARQPSPPGIPMLTVQDAQNALYSSFTLDKLVFGIFGSAVSLAMSPPMHNAAFDFCGMPHRYQIYQSPTLDDLKPVCIDPNFGGASISSPFKREILSLLHYVSPEAEAIGAVNTVIPLRSKRLPSLIERNRAGPAVALFGDNTDWIGVHTCIRRNLSPINAANNRKTALILGAGGMAQAAVYAAIRLESPSSSPQSSGTSTPINPTTGPIRVHAIPSLDESMPSGINPPTIIVSCIPMDSKDGPVPPNNRLPEAWLMSATGGVVIELAYNPRETPLLSQVRTLRKKGWIAVEGLEVLPEQGIAQFELFTGRTAPQHLMREIVAQRIKEMV
uniref:Quinate repressor protein n=1 Tax=Bionectria ochroleuca TaxID=29856 RepID=A0A0B7JJS1_BIOOC